MTTIIFVRHGQSTGNLAGVYCGQLDFPLTDKGKEQAVLLGNYLKNRYQIDAIYASDLCRAVQTAEPTARLFGLEISPEEDMREICVGEWQGQDADMIIRTRVEEMHRWRTDLTYAPKGGESFGQLRERVFRFVDRVLDKHRDQTVAVFGHAGAIGTILARYVTDSEKRNEITGGIELLNTEMCIFRFDGEKFIEVVEWGYRPHLPARATRSPENVV